jgi:mRNA interferase RelE/StbE
LTFLLDVLLRNYMRYEIEIRKRAEKDLAIIPKADAQHIADAIFTMENGLVGDIKKLSNYFPEYRLRVGHWRILFELSKSKIIIYRILNRKEAYK